MQVDVFYDIANEISIVQPSALVFHIPGPMIYAGRLPGQPPIIYSLIPKAHGAGSDAPENVVSDI